MFCASFLLLIANSIIIIPHFPFQIPESPIWLLNHDKTAEAEKALCWLRGWVTKDAISVEFEELTNYSIRARSCTACVKQNQKCSHPKPTFSEKLVELKRKQTMKPFCLVMLLFFIAAFSGIFSMAPFIVQIFEAYEIPIAPDQAAAYLAFGNNVGNFVFLCLISITGKRPLYLTTLTAVFLCSAVVCVYGFFVLPHGFNSFDHAIQFSLANKNLSYIPLVSIILWSFFFYCGMFRYIFTYLFLFQISHYVFYFFYAFYFFYISGRHQLYAVANVIGSFPVQVSLVMMIKCNFIQFI